MRRDFDDLAVSLATGQSRRGTLKKLLLGAIGVPAVTVGVLGLSEAEAKKKKKNKNKNKKKKVTLCQNGQTIKVPQKAKKKRLQQGATVGPCQDTPGCVPNANPCAGRECGSVDNGCGTPVQCGDCTDPEICDNNTGQCGCTPDNNPCDGRECGTVDDGCGTPVSCGTCSGTDTCNASGLCICTPDPNACAGRECGSVDNGCGQQVSCGECTSPETCDSTGQCTCTPIQNPCAGRECGAVDDGCGALVVCGPDNGDCPAATECVDAGVCNTNTGQCSFADKADNTPCGMNKCNRTCQSGVCTNTPVVCPDDTPCEEYTCDPNDGTCSATPKVCPPAPECQAGAGVCDPQTGECSYTDVPNDTPCGMNKCNRTCQEGVCEQVPVVCPPAGECQASICDPNDGTCSAPVAANQGAPCNQGSGVCVAGTCEVLTSGNICNNQSPCSAPLQCGNGGTSCVCYSTVEGGNLCIAQSEATCDFDRRPTGCNGSSDCPADEVCAPLNGEGPGTICCPNRPDLSGKIGFCVPISAVCPTL